MKKRLPSLKKFLAMLFRCKKRNGDLDPVVKDAREKRRIVDRKISGIIAQLDKTGDTWGICKLNGDNGKNGD